MEGLFGSFGSKKLSFLGSEMWGVGPQLMSLRPSVGELTPACVFFFFLVHMLGMATVPGAGVAVGLRRGHVCAALSSGPWKCQLHLTGGPSDGC